ncbi:MAG: hypothetical protein HKN43_00195 [Rhodothermales bacterium]|nr:hypothetical protein [Rhodothermales bacterium]
MREHLFVRYVSRPFILGLFVIQALAIDSAAGQSRPDNLANGFKYDTESGFFVASFSTGDSTVQVTVFDQLVFGAVDYATSQKSKVPNGERSSKASSDLFSSVPVSGTTSGLDGREYTFTVFPGEGVEINLADNEVFVDAVPLARFLGLYEQVTGRSFDISSMGMNEDGELSLRIEGIISNHALLVGALLVAFFMTIMLLLIRLVQVRHENILARLTWRKMIRAREDERTHLASELHDGPIQELQYITSSIAGGNHDPETSSVLNEVTDTLRKICTNLRPEVLAHFGLVSAVHGLIEEFSARHETVSTTIDINSPVQTLGYENDLAFYRILQESLSNVIKHADASRIDISLSIDESWAELTIRDDGCGFDMPRRTDVLVENGNLGLIGMMQRARSIDAAFEVISTDDGTLVRLVAKVETAALKADTERQLSRVDHPVRPIL